MQYEMPGEFKKIKEGGLRRLTLGEIQLSITLFSYSIRYHEVWIHRDSYLPFGMQNNSTAMTPNGEMWFEKTVYSHDFSMAGTILQHMFLHEMMHVYQHQQGMFVRTRGLFSWAVNYQYRLNKEKLSDYSMEQQASIVSDYWLLKYYGFFGTGVEINYQDYDPAKDEMELKEQYKKILKGFLS
ncbi:type IV secretion protein Rhs [Rahnella sp. NRRL B-41462]|uniref:type IV secretion protein Rhs n=1 Tax=Rahnella sp. NRRL B-41462 TaxID=1610579 RepID=UPI001E478C2A|nr:type IV secretion protein Rhs [Rahnella sp. NRRL B-41462]